MPADALPALDLGGLTGRQIDALASIPQRHIWQGSDFDTHDLRVAADEVMRCGVCVLPSGDGGLMMVGPKAEDGEAVAAFQARRRRPANRPEHRALAAALHHHNHREQRLLTRLRTTVFRALAPRRSRAREHRAASSRRSRVSSSRGSPSGDPDEPSPPIGGTS